MSAKEYPKLPDYNKIIGGIVEYSRLKHECGAKGIQALLEEAGSSLSSILSRLEALPADLKFTGQEPDDPEAIRKVRPNGPAKLWKAFNAEKYRCMEYTRGSMKGGQKTRRSLLHLKLIIP